MGHVFYPAPAAVMARQIFPALEAGHPVLGIPRENFYTPAPSLALSRFGRSLAAPLGVAAGPHTQLSQNIVAAWLCGARFIELKTVQVLDNIHVSRPCIDAADETYNCEWSQELSLEQSFQEYLNAWVLVHALAHALGLPDPGAIFAMSVGYDLKGIQSPTVQRFIARMRDASEELAPVIDAVAQVYPAVRDVTIPADLSNAITLSTMHGCPPTEIERIARYLLTELGVHTWVKLNPTLLGPTRLRSILNERMGWGITVPDAAFEHDPRFGEAMEMVVNLRDTAKDLDVGFGLKLSNTLEVINHRPVFPSNEKMMYMSGKALHPLTLTLANLVNETLDGSVPISFCGGADAFNFPSLVADGLGPVTVCTDLLKSGGYARLNQYLANLEGEMARVNATTLDEFVRQVADARPDADLMSCARGNLERHVERTLGEDHLKQRERPLATKSTRSLGYFDCIAAPCQEACPTHQNIPDYMHLVASGRDNEALEVILRTNCLPAITGGACDHPCTEHCVRNHYDAPLAIRAIKRFAVEHATEEPALKAGVENGIKVAVVGAGPGGLAAAFYLRLRGFGVTVFDSRPAAGGMVRGVIPPYRLADSAISQDVARVIGLGAELRYGVRVGKDVTFAQLKAEGYQYFVVAAGAEAGKKLGVPGEETVGVFDGIDFLTRARGGEKLALGRRTLVVGAGNSAMDCARTARRLLKGGESIIVYRRTRAQMPADLEELEGALEEGVEVRDLLAPLEVVAEGGKVKALRCQRMQLGAPDASGRARPEPVAGAIEDVACDSIIVAISQEPRLGFLDELGVKRRKDGTLEVSGPAGETSVAGVFAGGDVVRGPASIIKAAADGRLIAEEIGRRHGYPVGEEPVLEKGKGVADLLAKKAMRLAKQTVPVLPVQARGGFDEVLGGYDVRDARAEAARCLDCDELCSICVTVCPNRANQAYELTPFSVAVPSLVRQGEALALGPATRLEIRQGIQIVNVADYCNECGNCVTFCPTAGQPWHDKPRFYRELAAFEAAGDGAFHLAQGAEEATLQARLGGRLHVFTRRGEKVTYRLEGLEVSLRCQGSVWEVAEVKGSVAELPDLKAVLPLVALFEAKTVLPA